MTMHAQGFIGLVRSLDTKAPIPDRFLTDDLDEDLNKTLAAIWQPRRTPNQEDTA